jgi:hypothetical protein
MPAEIKLAENLDQRAQDALAKMKTDLKHVLRVVGDPRFKKEAVKRLFINPVLMAIADCFDGLSLDAELPLIGSLGQGVIDYVLAFLEKYYILVTEAKRDEVAAAVAQCVVEMTAVSEVSGVPHIS